MSRRDDSIDDPRRQFLLRALAGGALIGGAGWNLDALASIFGTLPSRMPEGKSIFEMSGEVSINGKAATMASRIEPGDVLRTGKGAHLIGVVGDDALLVRENSQMEIAGARQVRRFFRLVTGALLTVLGPKKQTFDIATPVATIGVRGTGVYTEADPEKTYICTCYGKTQISAVADRNATENIQSRHHDAPRYVLAKPQDGKRIVPGGFRDHTDLELMTLEALVGRQVPFKVSDTGEYLGPRRDY
ncbi:MAG TPA: FecR domain-containing protein [Nevskiaceae bacterium]|nr:FecR domain-containing protein [Nevskiaceae bacterium]